MAELDELYQDILLHHVNHPVHRAQLGAGEVDAEVHNPLCGDRVRLALDVEAATIRRARFDGEGCAICMASAAIAAESASGQSCVWAASLCQQMLRVWNHQADLPADAPQPLAAIAGVRRFPMRIKCAQLPWLALQQALERKCHLAAS